MKICYVDESGDTGALPTSTSPVQPVLTIVSIVVDHADLHSLTTELLNLKGRFFPGLIGSRQYLSWILPEVKGSELRQKIANGSRRERRHSFGVLDKTIDILENHHVRLFGRVWIKGVGDAFDGRAVYTSSIQSIYETFQHLLNLENDIGLVIADSRNPHTNSQVSHSIFTQKFKVGGDDHGRIIDLPTFAHSNNHSGLQLTDFVCSSIITPIAINTYCEGHVRNLHVKPKYRLIKDRYVERIKPLLHRYQDGGRWKGGLTVSDAIAQRPSSLMFQI